LLDTHHRFEFTASLLANKLCQVTGRVVDAAGNGDSDITVKQNIGGRFYLRYMDNFLLFHDDKAFLHDAKANIRSLLSSLKLELKPGKARYSR